MRVQHPKVHQRKDRKGTYWFFRYWHDELLPDGSIKSTRKFHTIGPNKGEGALTKREAEAERDRVLAELNAAPTRAEAAVLEKQPLEIGAILFGKLAEMWESDFVEREVGGRPLVAASTKQKYHKHLHNHILPRWAGTRIAEFRAKDVLDWLHEECGSWYMMADLRNIMSGIFTKAQEWEILPDTFANPMARVKLPKKWEVYEKRILTEDETIRVLAHLEDPHLLICEICVTTGARISEVTGLQIKHADLNRGSIRIEQRNWRTDIDTPKTEKSKRMLALRSLVERFRTWIASLKHKAPEAWLFPQEDDPRKPMWDSGVRAALKKAARAEKCVFSGFGTHSLRRANITWRQEVGGSSIEASRIAGHANTKITEEYTVVQLKRQEQLTRRIQSKLLEAERKVTKQKAELNIPLLLDESLPLAPAPGRIEESATMHPLAVVQSSEPPCDDEALAEEPTQAIP
ncbi:MAG: tyrosine-type recombinase/integrase [Acidobacteria bacterium]|nr:tyrosine-type recombinase/integrase [Acidobacteriota bacterium]